MSRIFTVVTTVPDLKPVCPKCGSHHIGKPERVEASTRVTVFALSEAGDLMPVTHDSSEMLIDWSTAETDAPHMPEWRCLGCGEPLAWDAGNKELIAWEDEE